MPAEACELLERGQFANAFGSHLKAIQWMQIHLMESWGQRDNSLGRFGTRFAIEARRQGMGELVEELDNFCSLDRAAVEQRLTLAPRWVVERRDRSWDARMAIDEPVTRLQNDRDVLRVCTTYELRLHEQPPYPAWLAVPEPTDLVDRLDRLETLLP